VGSGVAVFIGCPVVDTVAIGVVYGVGEFVAQGSKLEWCLSSMDDIPYGIATIVMHAHWLLPLTLSSW